ncbi:MAG: WD40 repeat domain-containing protein, partial [Myxococcales bacterium]|nr:WD40 repeat domain-containing protein [Myxococcales bacterium]
SRGTAILSSPSGDPIYAVVFSPDDRRLAGGTSVGDILLWDVEGEDHELRVLSGHDKEVWELDYDSRGRRLASASFDGTVRVWDPATGSELLTLRGHEQATAVHFEPGDRRIFSGGTDGVVRVWDASSGEQLLHFEPNCGEIWRLRRSPDGRTLGAACNDGSAWLWPDDDPSHGIALRGHRQRVWQLAFDVTGERVVTTSFDNDARVWSVADGSLLRRLSGHGETVWAA